MSRSASHLGPQCAEVAIADNKHSLFSALRDPLGKRLDPTRKYQLQQTCRQARVAYPLNDEETLAKRRMILTNLQERLEQLGIILPARALRLTA